MICLFILIAQFFFFAFSTVQIIVSVDLDIYSRMSSIYVNCICLLFDDKN